MAQNVVGAIGLDLGSLRTSIAQAKRGGVEIIINEGSNRETPNIVGYGEKERFIGENGFVRYKSNFKNTVAFPTRFLAMSAKNPNFEIEKKFITCPTATLSNDKIAFEVFYQGEKKTLLPEQVLASYLQKIKQTTQRVGNMSNEMVFSVPSYFTEQERKALLDAAKIAEINVLRLFNEESAIATSYGLFRKKEFDEKNPRTVVFVDLGHSKLTAFAADFTTQKAKIRYQTHNRNLGTRNLDWFVLEILSKKFSASSGGLNPIQNPKAKLRLLEAIEKQRKVLSANSEAAVNIEYLIEDYDLNDTLKKEDYEILIQPVLNQIAECLNELVNQLKVLKLDIHSVEIVGGGTRIPCVQKIIQDVFGVPNLMRTLNASESISRGCAVQCAVISPQFSVAEYSIEEFNYHPIKCSWQFFEPNSKMEIEDIKNQSDIQKATLFDRGCAIPCVKTLTFNNNKGISFCVYYDPVLPGFTELLGYYTIHQVKAKEKEFAQKVKVTLNKNGVIDLEEANLVEDYYETYEVPKEQPKDQKKPETNQSQPKTEENKDQMNVEKPEDGTKPTEEQNKDQAQNQQKQPEKPVMETKTRKKSRFTKLKYDSQILNQYLEKEIQQFFEVEATMTNHDRTITETYEKKNLLESKIYEIRNKIADNYKPFLPPGLEEQVLQLLEQSENWLYEDGENAAKSQYVKKIDAIMALWNPVEKRFCEYRDLPAAIQGLCDMIVQFENWANNAQDPKYIHITLQERQNLLNESNNLKNWINQCNQVQSTIQTHQDPVTNIAEITKKYQEFNQKASALMNKPKPEEPKKEKAEKKKEKDEQANKNNNNNNNEEQKQGEQTKKPEEKQEMEVE